MLRYLWIFHRVAVHTPTICYALIAKRYRIKTVFLSFYENTFLRQTDSDCDSFFSHFNCTPIRLPSDWQFDLAGTHNVHWLAWLRRAEHLIILGTEADIYLFRLKTRGPKSKIPNIDCQSRVTHKFPFQKMKEEKNEEKKWWLPPIL